MTDSTFMRISEMIPDVIINLKYMTKDNFIGKRLYDEEHDRLRYGTLKKLKIASDILRKKNYRLIIWDAYRPLQVQEIFWDAMPDERFVARPSRGSKHNRGCAVDVTLAAIDGEECEMPSMFDDFTDAARADQGDLKPEVMDRLKCLQHSMLEAGFEVLVDEWWHFNDSDWEMYSVE